MLHWIKRLFANAEAPAPSKRTDEIPPAESHEISPIEVKQKLDENSALILVDVRTQEEREQASIPGSLHIPRNDIHARYSEISDDPSAEIIVFCHYGIESEQVMHQLWGLGFQNAKIMSGGIDAWSVEIDPKVRRY
ncbi:MAG: hypothetical protein JXR73_22525 [Candidatus Omnitrophica bacterium]|nr:hypothetical protein [Candidatus Omnitrophota bacterium]